VIGNGPRDAPDSGTTVSKPSANDLPEAQTVEATHPAPAEAVKAAVTKAAAPDAAPVEATPEETTAPTAGTEAKRAPSCHSFAGSTGVLMADGAVKAIDQIKIGDKIADAVPGQDATLANTVTAVIVTHTDHDFVDLTIAPEPTSPTGKTATTAKTTASATSKAASKLSAGKKFAIGLTAAATVIAGASVTPAAHAVQHGGTLTTTYLHPFYDITQQAFVDAQYLKVGDELQTTTGRAEVASIRLYHADTTTYDLTIGELHTYYVVAGDTPVLVHNSNGGGMPYDACPVSYSVNGLRHGAYGEGETELDLIAGGYTNVTREVTFTNRNGNPFRADFIAKDPQGQWTAVETKTSGGGASGRLVGPDVVSRMDADQVTGYYDLAHGGLTLSTDKLAAYGFSHGDNFTVSSFGRSSKVCPYC
jgi:hypothetical protein